MAIGAKGQVTTTGMMGEQPKTPAAPDLRALSAGQKQQPKQQPQPTPQPEANPMELEFAERAKTLTDEDKSALQSVLSPSVRTALGKILPEFKPVMDQFGSQEPNVIIPLSTVKSFAMKRYGGQDEQEAINNFMTDILADSMPQQQQPMEQQQQPVPPRQGLMSSPQT
jgi:hypothetical protein